MSLPGHDPAQVRLEQHEDGVMLGVKVVPGASRSKVMGVWDTALRVAIAAPPEAGKANVALVKLLSSVFGVGRSGVVILAGQTRPRKRVLVRGIKIRDARRRIAAALD